MSNDALSASDGHSTAWSAALADTIAVAVAAALKPLRSPRLRGPFPHPDSGDLRRAAYLQELARWARAAALRSRRTLGPRRAAETLDAAGRLAALAALLAALEAAPTDASAQSMASAAIREIELIGPPPSPRPGQLGSRLLDLAGWLGELIRSAQRPHASAVRQ